MRRYVPAAWRTSTNHTGTRTSTVHRLRGGEPPVESLEMILRADARGTDYFAGETESDPEG